MNLVSLILWILGMGLITLLGSLSARKYNRGTLLIALLSVLAASARLLSASPVRMLHDHDWYVEAGVFPLALSMVCLCAIVEKFAQAEGHRAALFATVSQALALIVLAGARQFQAASLGGMFEAAASGGTSPLQLTPWLALSSLTGYLMGANLCVVLYHMVRVVSGERRAWLRAIVAPLAGGSVETLVYLTLGFGGREFIGPFVLARLLAYVIVAVMAIPLLALHRTLQGRRVNP